MFESLKAQKKGITYALIFILLSSTVGTSLKLAVTDMDSYTVAIYVGMLMVLALGIWLLITRKMNRVWVEFNRQKLFYIFTGILGYGIQQLLYIMGYEFLPAAKANMIFYIYPLLMVFLAALIFKEKVSLLSVGFIVMGFCGVYIMQLVAGSLLPELGWGSLVVLSAALCWALFSVLIKYNKFDVDIGIFLFSIFGIIFLLALIPWFGFNYKISLTQALGLIYIAVFATALNNIFWNLALRNLKIQLISNLALGAPLLGLVWIILILGEKISVPHIIGIILVLGSVLLNINFGNNKRTVN